MSTKVLCIDGVPERFKVVHNWGGVQYQNTATKQTQIYEGTIYTVSEDTVYMGIPCYGLSEIGAPYKYRKSRFIPVSDIDETEFIREELTETV